MKQLSSIFVFAVLFFASFTACRSQAIFQIRARCPVSIGGYAENTIGQDGNIYYVPCSTKSSIFSGGVDFSGATVTGLPSTSPLTTKGDVWGFSTVNARVPVGSDTQVLTADSTQPLGIKWAAAPGGITNGAGANNIPKSDGTNLVTSRLSDAGSPGDMSALAGLTLSQGVITTNQPTIGGTATWNAGGVTFFGIDELIGDSASASASMLLRLRNGASNIFEVGKSANLIIIQDTTTADLPPVTTSSVWNNAGVTFNNITSSINNSASAATSHLINLLVGGVTVFNVDVTGAIVNAGPSNNINLSPTSTGVINANHALVSTPVSLTDNGTTIATDASLSNNFKITAITANVTLSNPINPTNGQRVVWEVIQNASAAKTLALGTKFGFGAEITACTISAGLSSRSFITAQYGSTADKWYVVGCVTGY